MHLCPSLIMGNSARHPYGIMLLAGCTSSHRCRRCCDSCLEESRAVASAQPLLISKANFATPVAKTNTAVTFLIRPPPITRFQSWPGASLHAVAAAHPNPKSSTRKMERKGTLVCKGKPVDSEVIYWRDVPGDADFESPITLHHHNHHERYLAFAYDQGG